MRCCIVSVLNIGLFQFSSQISVTLVSVLSTPPLVNPICQQLSRTIVRECFYLLVIIKNTITHARVILKQAAAVINTGPVQTCETNTERSAATYISKECRNLVSTLPKLFQSKRRIHAADQSGSLQEALIRLVRAHETEVQALPIIMENQNVTY